MIFWVQRPSEHTTIYLRIRFLIKACFDFHHMVNWNCYQITVSSTDWVVSTINKLWKVGLNLWYGVFCPNHLCFWLKIKFDLTTIWSSQSDSRKNQPGIFQLNTRNEHFHPVKHLFHRYLVLSFCECTRSTNKANNRNSPGIYSEYGVLGWEHLCTAVCRPTSVVLWVWYQQQNCCTEETGLLVAFCWRFFWCCCAAIMRKAWFRLFSPSLDFGLLRLAFSTVPALPIASYTLALRPNPRGFDGSTFSLRLTPMYYHGIGNVWQPVDRPIPVREYKKRAREKNAPDECLRTETEKWGWQLNINTYVRLCLFRAALGIDLIVYQIDIETWWASTAYLIGYYTVTLEDIFLSEVWVPANWHPCGALVCYY